MLCVLVFLKERVYPQRGIYICGEQELARDTSLLQLVNSLAINSVLLEGKLTFPVWCPFLYKTEQMWTS